MLGDMALLDTSDRAEAAVRRRELATFLRNRRERLTPADLGIPSSGRRRTPGLRREEVAQVAGVGVTWYTWLEQGRDIAPSPQVLEAIARTLQLDQHERTHLFRLSGALDPGAIEGCYAVPETAHLLLEQLEPYPAAVVNSRYDLLAYNVTYQAVIGDLDSLPVADRNSLWLMFTNPRTRESILDWEVAAPRMVASLRAAMAEHVAEPAWKCFVGRMINASPEFAEIWDRHEVRPIERMSKRMISPNGELLQLETTSLWLSPEIGTRLVTYTPADELTGQRLEQLYADARRSRVA